MKAHVVIDYHDVRMAWLIRATVKLIDGSSFHSYDEYQKHPTEFNTEDIKEIFPTLKDQIKLQYPNKHFYAEPSLIGCKYEWIVNL